MSYIQRIARQHSSVTFGQAELAYYSRHLLLPGVGLVGQQKLKSACVLLVGAGGLGCPALQALAGAGVGSICIVDGDAVGHSNLSRQWLHSVLSIGENKAFSAQAAHGALYRESAQMGVFWSRCGARFQRLFPEPSEAPSS